LQRLPLDLLPLVISACPELNARERVWSYVRTWRQVRPTLTGHDLQRLGVPQGPLIGQLLARLLAAKLDGEAPTRLAEEALVRQLRSDVPCPTSTVRNSTLDVGR